MKTTTSTIFYSCFFLFCFVVALNAFGVRCSSRYVVVCTENHFENTIMVAKSKLQLKKQKAKERNINLLSGRHFFSSILPLMWRGSDLIHDICWNSNLVFLSSIKLQLFIEQPSDCCHLFLMGDLWNITLCFTQWARKKRRWVPNLVNMRWFIECTETNLWKIIIHKINWAFIANDVNHSNFWITYFLFVLK